MKIKIKINSSNILCTVINTLNTNNIDYNIYSDDYEYAIYISDNYSNNVYDLLKYTINFHKNDISLINNSNDVYISEDYYRKYNLNYVTDVFIEVTHYYNYMKNIHNDIHSIINDLNNIYNRTSNTILIIKDINLIKLLREKLKQINNTYYYDVYDRIDEYIA